MKLLTIHEEILLLAIWRLKKNAYGVTIREQVMKATMQKIVYGTLYNSLDKLVKKGFVITKKGDPSPERGGRSKVFYILTPAGQNALRKSKELHQSIWDGIPDAAMGTESNE